MIKKKALYFFIGKSSFVDKDIDTFSELYELKIYNFELGKKWRIPFQLLHQLFFLIRNSRKSKVCLVQLAGIHSFFPILISKFTGNKSVIIAGGTDCHSFPSIGYGNYQRPFLALATKFSFRFCSLILPKHTSLWRTSYTYDDHDYSEQGISFFNKGIKTPHLCIENGYNAEKFKSTQIPVRNSFITIAGLLNKISQQKLKGIDLILEAAKNYPDFSFTIVGGKPEYFSELSSNVHLIPTTPNSELPEILSRHQYYLQLSMAEGFPNALCEAMLCECIPIGSDVFSIPEIIGDTGYILKKRNIKELNLLFDSLSNSIDNKNGIAAREKISNSYGIENRKNKLKAALEKL